MISALLWDVTQRYLEVSDVWGQPACPVVRCLAFCVGGLLDSYRLSRNFGNYQSACVKKSEDLNCRYTPTNKNPSV